MSKDEVRRLKDEKTASLAVSFIFSLRQRISRKFAFDPLRELADRHKLLIIEDAAEAHGAEYLTGEEKVLPDGRAAEEWVT